MKYHTASRRMFLQGAGGSLLAIPFLPSLFMSSRASAAGVVLPKYVHINSNLMIPRSLSYPLYANPYVAYDQPTGTNPNSVPWMQKDADTKYQSLQSIINYQGKISFTFNEKWNPYASRMNLVTNAHAYVRSNNHNSSVSSACSTDLKSQTGNGDVCGPHADYNYSADYLVEQAFAKKTPSTIPALRMNHYDNDGGYTSFCFGLNSAGAPVALPMMQSLAELNLKLSGSQNANPLSKETTNRISRLDSVLQDYQRLMNHRRISSVDKQRLSDAVDLIHQNQKQLQSAGSQCSFPGLGSVNTMDWGIRHRAAIDAIVAALACGVTRVVSYGLIQAGDSLNDQGILHGMEHDQRGPNEVDPQIKDAYYQAVTWRSNMVAYFLSKLDSVKDENGQPLLNSSVVAWAHQYSDNGHSMLGHTLAMVGTANGKLDTGYHVDAGGAPVNRFHLTNMLAMGLTLADIEKNGNAGFGEVETLISTGDNSFRVITSEQDDKQNDPSKRSYNTSKLPQFQQVTERRKPFPYLKA